MNGTTAKEITAIKDALIDKQSEAFKDIESDFIRKLDSTMSTFYPTTSFELSYIDFVQGMFKIVIFSMWQKISKKSIIEQPIDTNKSGILVPHFTVELPEDESLPMVVRDLKTELGLLDQADDVVDLGYNPDKINISNDIQREFGMRVVYKDAR